MAILLHLELKVPQILHIRGNTMTSSNQAQSMISIGNKKKRESNLTLKLILQHVQGYRKGLLRVIPL